MPIAKAYYYQDPTITYNDDVQGGFAPIPSGYMYLGSDFFPEWFNAPDGEYDWVETSWGTMSVISANDLHNISNDAHQQIINEGQGVLLATRFFHKEVFNVRLPDTYSLPNFLPFGIGGTHNVPFGGTTVASLHKYKMQMLYHNPLPVVLAVAIAVVAIIGFAVAIDEVTHGKYALTRHLVELLNNLTPGEVGKDVTQVFIFMAVAFGLAAIVLPNISQPSVNLSGKAGPVSIGVSQASRAPTAPPRRR